MVETLVITEKFPEITLLATIDSWWVEEQSEALTLAGTAAPTKKPSLMTPLKTIDSHRVVRCILELEPVLGIDIPESVIQKGGYDTIAELKADLVEKLKALHAKAHVA
jgi:acyl carrier protein